jgi:hypothetical protein
MVGARSSRKTRQASLQTRKRRALAPRRPRLMVGRERKRMVLTSPSPRLRMMMSRMATRMKMRSK